MNTYKPNYVSVPGETLLETMNALGLTQVDIAERTGRTPKTINEIIKGKAPITPDTAIQFESVLGVPASFWNTREKNYREYLARASALNQRKLQVSWLSKFPIREMVSYGWLPDVGSDKVEQLGNLLAFFGVSHPLHWGRIYRSLKLTYRKAYSGVPNFNSLTAWLRKGELVGKSIECKPFNRSKFLENLKTIRSLTTKDIKEASLEMNKLCSGSGVALVFTRELPKLFVCGATRWLNHEKALIQLSLVYKTNDQVWFTFFHEAAHICLHSKKDVFVDGKNIEGLKESEANRFAEDMIVPRREYDEYKQTEISEESILKFSYTHSIAPGMVVGRLQHEKIVPYNRFNNLKKTFVWEE
jgi:HTH-type transcriptional regulator / antitoxin HigA